MAYDEALAGRIRDLIGDDPSPVEKRMFGGLGFMVGGHLAVAASGQGGILVRVDPAEGAELLATTPAEPMEMRGRAMTSWLRVAPEHLDDGSLAAWVRRGVDHAGSLPPK